MVDTGLAERTMLVTGGAGGIGAAVASHQARWITGQVPQVAGGHAL